SPETAADEAACAKRILTNLARRAYRRPVREADLEPLLAFYASGVEGGGFETGIQKALMAILASVDFLYRTEPNGPPRDLPPGSAVAARATPEPGPLVPAAAPPAPQHLASQDLPRPPRATTHPAPPPPPLSLPPREQVVLQELTLLTGTTN